MRNSAAPKQEKGKGEDNVETRLDSVENVGVEVTGAAGTKENVAGRSVDLDSKPRG